MRDALLADLAAISGMEVVATVDPRFPLPASLALPFFPISSPSALPGLIAGAEALWLIAPESGERLARLAATAERARVRLLGPGARAIGLATHKLRLVRRLAARHLPVPATRPALPRPPGPAGCAAAMSGPLGYPLVAKPARGAGCEGVSLVSGPAELPAAVDLASRAEPRAPVLLQEYIEGVPASVSLLCDGTRVLPLALNRQDVLPGAPFSYGGGETPFDHPLATRARQRALAACAAVPGLRGYIGVDLVLARGDAVVLEINPRLTTSYLGLRRAVDGNLGQMALEAALGVLPEAPPLVRRVRFGADGTIAAEEALP